MVISSHALTLLSIQSITVKSMATLWASDFIAFPTRSFWSFFNTIFGMWFSSLSRLRKGKAKWRYIRICPAQHTQSELKVADRVNFKKILMARSSTEIQALRHKFMWHSWYVHEMFFRQNCLLVVSEVHVLLRSQTVVSTTSNTQIISSSFQRRENKISHQMPRWREKDNYGLL